MATDSLDRRLTQAVHEAGYKSIRAFQRALPEDVRGTSYESVYRYMRGEREPGPEFLEAAARLLGVRSEWLEGDDGPMADDTLIPDTENRSLREAWEAERREELERRSTVIAEGVRRAAFVPPVGRQFLQRFVADVHDRLGPEAFGLEEADELTADHVEAFVARTLFLPHPADEEAVGAAMQVSEHERMANTLAQLASAYLRVFGGWA